MRAKSKIIPTPGTLVQYLLKNIKPRFSKQGTTAAGFPLDNRTNSVLRNMKQEIHK